MDEPTLRDECRDPLVFWAADAITSDERTRNLCSGPTPGEPLADVERRYILKVLEASGGNKSLAAETLGLSRKTLYRKLSAWGLTGNEI